MFASLPFVARLRVVLGKAITKSLIEAYTTMSPSNLAVLRSNPLQAIYLNANCYVAIALISTLGYKTFSLFCIQTTAA